MSSPEYPDLLPYVIDAFKAHQELAKAPKDSVRFFDGETPYIVHPLWCATMIAQEPLLPRDIRIEGVIALLHHDLPEDTNAPLPDNLSPEAYQSIQDMTFPGGMREEMKTIWNKSPKIRLFKLYDKVSNLLTATWMTPEKLREYINYTERLLSDVEQQFGPLNIVIIARAVIQELRRDPTVKDSSLHQGE